MKLSILMPVYNEAYTLEQIVSEVMAARLPEDVTRELIIVDDASTDKTPVVLKKLLEQYPEIRTKRQPENRGKGAAIKEAVDMATGDVCVIQDADLEYSPSEYSRLLAPILSGEADAVYGSRFLSSDKRRVLYFWHSVGNRFLTMVSNMFTNLNLTDMETCYKMVRAEILKSIPLRSARFGMEPELTAKLSKRGCRIYEVPISYAGRTYQEGKKIGWRDGVKALITIIWFWLIDDLYREDKDKAILHSLSSMHRFNRWMADQVRPWIGERVLEIGAGMGNLSRQFLPREQYTVSDIDEQHLVYLQNSFESRKNIDVRHLDLTSPTEFAAVDEQFDTVVCLNVVEHTDDDMQSLRNILTALAPGGRACVLVPRSQKLYGTLDETLGHCRRYSKEELASRMRDVGFEIEKVFTFNRISVPAWWWNGKVLKRRHFGKVQLKLLDSTMWFWRRVDRFLPWQGVSVIAIGKKT